MPFDDENQIIRNWQYERKRNAYLIDWSNINDPDHVLYIPLNRLQTPYQTEKATNWDKVQENVERMANGELLAPIEIGYDYDIHDGHHRFEASHLMDYSHVPCVVKGNNDLDIQRARANYQEVWKSFSRDLQKSIIADPTGNDPFRLHNAYMYRGIGLAELNFIHQNGYIESKGTGNDEDKEAETCFSNLFSQAEGYARSNYDVYQEPSAYVIILPKPEHAQEDEHGEITLHGKIPLPMGSQIVPIPKE